MAQSCLLRSTSAITVPQFTDALRRTWLESHRFRPGTGSALPRRLGLAVSGGADSMALAYLCRQWELQRQKQQQQQQQEPGQEHHILPSKGDDSGHNEASVTAFVVDHKARPESTEEANTVAQWLRKLGTFGSLFSASAQFTNGNPGITTQILPLDWTGVSLSAFETHARRLRFQALGKACRDARIDALVMGHHQDDNVETLIWRLSTGARGPGLAGIAPVAKVPECHGLHGVAGSGGVALVRAKEYRAAGEGQKRADVPVSTGDILIYRPLLSFPKSRLLATCHENDVPYVSDPTNFDPTLTPRNAIRSLLALKTLPRALQEESMLSLTEKCRGIVRDSQRFSDNLLASQTRLLDLSLAAGSITVQFRPPFLPPHPPAPSSSNPEDHEGANERAKELPPKRLQKLRSMTLRRITELVSPFEDNHFPLSKFVWFADRVFPPATPTPTPSTSPEPEPDATPKPPEDSTPKQPRKPFTLGGVLFHPEPFPPRSPEQGDNGDTWLLTRQPYMRRREPVLRFNVSVSKGVPTVPNQRHRHSTRTRPHPEVKPEYSIPWTLWDNRFWIRASASTSTPRSDDLDAVFQQEHERIQLVIRPLQQKDLTPIKELYEANKKNKMTKGRHSQARAGNRASQDTFNPALFFTTLKREAPRPSLFMLPVIALEEKEGVDAALALPTMNLRFPALEAMPWNLTWEWKYKMIDLEALKLMGSV
ncbi:hypothetical protein BDW74DRAFT_178454 [Aspergillus multicolor]|uniref:tRNA lysidine(34) synthetase n=1 Tax=Aspergillus multicolor TaxID=41759 RepID=UPI003CCD4C00